MLLRYCLAAVCSLSFFFTVTVTVTAEVHAEEDGSPMFLRGNGGLQVSNDVSINFPSVAEALDMAKLAALVYDFKDKDLDYCSEFHTAESILCQWYYHDETLGTQVMIVQNHNKGYFAVVFAGTDDLRTSLADANIFQKAFGNNSTVQLDDPEIRVHAGFNNAVFSGVFEEIAKRLRWLKIKHPLYKLYTTGHSLGAADSILTATALAMRGYTVVSINFGCPKTGNKEWEMFFNATSPLNSKLGIWRIVLGWDLVARLPEFFRHVGHTIQLWGENHSKYDEGDPDLVECYYHHYGDEQLGYAGTPSGWNAKPYAWMPGALSSHFVQKYVDYLEMLSQKKLWVDHFKKIKPIGYDDDVYDEPPDDWYGFDSDADYQEATLS